MALSLWVVLGALADAYRSAERRLLLAIYFVLVGQFGHSLSKYHAHLAEKLDSSDRKKDSTSVV